MSNRAVSATYRTVIDDVISNVRQDFEDMGIEREVLEELQRSWEAKIVATGVADFDGAAPVNPRGRNGKSKGEAGAQVKKEDDDDGKAKAEPSASNGDGKRARIEGDDDVSAQRTDASAKQAKNEGNDSAEGDGKKRKKPSDDDEIGSDLDDSDEDIDAEADGDEDLILCLYDKVQRVRNKWKCVLKDGVASIDGRDYVFSKLASELEW